MKQTFQKIKTERIQMAKDLCYGKETLERLKSAKTERQLSDIMAEARRAM